MWSNHLKIALRNFRRQAFFSLINVSGLAVGLAACWLIALFVWHEHSFDQQLPLADRICAVALDLKMGDQQGLTTNTPPPLGLRLAADFPEIELSARSFHVGSAVVKQNAPGHAPLVFNEKGVMAVDTGFLELFDFPMTEGQAGTVLDRPGGLVLTEKMVEKYFGKSAAMGQPLSINDRIYTVTGVVKNLPATSTLQFDFLLPMADFRAVDQFAWSWVWLQMDTWVRLRQPATAESITSLEAKFPAMVRTYAPAAYARLGQNLEEQLRKGDRLDVKLLSLKSLHLSDAELDSRLGTLGDGQQVQLFGIVGGLILLLACVNFMNLATARSMKRGREVGVRKALGSQRSALVSQFLTESLLVSSAAFVLAMALVITTLPYFSRLTEIDWVTADLFSPPIIGWVLALPLLTGLLGGLYPAFYLSRFKAAEAFKTSLGSAKSGHTSFRSGLVVFQFTVSIALMLGSLVVFRQLEFARKKSPGLQRENVLIVKNARYLGEPSSTEAFRQQLLQMPGVKSVTHSTFLPPMGSFGDFYEPEQGDQNHAVLQNLSLSSYMSDADFVPTLGLELLAGRNFGRDNGIGDSTSVLLNETAVKTIGWEKPLGKWLRYPGNPSNQRFQVVGILRDFHIGSIKAPIEPVAVFHESSRTYYTHAIYLAVRLQPGVEKMVIDKTSALWAATVPGTPFEYDFLDASFARLYQSEAKTTAVLSIFTLLALFIGCLGLFALAAFTAEQRTKEIGIRKVLGASVAGITTLLARDFLKLVLISILLACPLAAWALHKWLQDYAYRIELQGWMFALAGLTAVGVAFLTVSFQSIKAALANPVKSLRNE